MPSFKCRFAGILSLLFSAQICSAFPRKTIPIDPALVDTDAVSVDVTIENNAFGTCMCDITRNACDAYCCCDLDCGSAILDVWKSDYDNICAKNYIGQAFKPAQKCISTKQLHAYNERMGMSVSDEQGLFCVEMDAASPTATYQEYREEIPAGTIIQALEDLDMSDVLYSGQGYVDKYGLVDQFDYLDEMLSYSEEKMIQNFLLPQRDLFGFCDNFKSASFLRNVDADTEGSCVQSFTDLSLASSTFLNPLKYNDKREYLLGSSKGSQSAPFKVSKIYLRDSDTGAISTLSSTPAAPTYIAGLCSVQNFVSEVLYRVYYTENAKGFYVIKDIQIEFMLDSLLNLDDNFCVLGNTQEHRMTQKFGITFVVAREAGSDTYLTTLEEIAETAEVSRSGNPGYQFNQPLIVAQGANSAGSKEVSVIGTYIKGPQKSGACLAAGETAGPSQRIDFGKQTTTSCFKTFDTYADLKAFCTSTTERMNLEIFAQFLDRFQSVAIFGNPNINFSGDWIATISEAAKDAISQAGTADDARESCKLYTALEIEILTSKVGYIDNMQNYVVGVNITPIENEWTFESDITAHTDSNNFTLFVSLAFSQILPKEFEASGFVSFSLIKGNLFYPLEITGGATMGLLASVGTLVATLGLLMF